ncbi:hypothetical protein M8C21_019237 [Ambrosia artemisiifolia]|uniref:Uncharacterized protein n=1 Tax=Ambrosia artemisiifolia TaxID=4212 RepID=A0AAD5C5A1_AMBAR|nr:hypothetical protein M8C21_019237 [Ambrosia artemisiifolia]
MVHQFWVLLVIVTRYRKRLVARVSARNIGDDGVFDTDGFRERLSLEFLCFVMSSLSRIDEQSKTNWSMRRANRLNALATLVTKNQRRIILFLNDLKPAHLPPGFISTIYQC